MVAVEWLWMKDFGVASRDYVKHGGHCLKMDARAAFKSCGSRVANYFSNMGNHVVQANRSSGAASGA